MHTSPEQVQSQSHTKWANRLLTAGLPLIALFLAFGLRVYHLGLKSIWWDEAHSWWYARMPLWDGIREGMAAWHGAAGDPLFTVVLHTWMRLVGDSAFAMRYLSTLAGLLTVAYLGCITARVFGPRAGQAALFVGAISPIWIFYSQEVRQYTLIPGIALISLDAVLQIASSDTTYSAKEKWLPWGQLAIGEALALYTHSFMVFAVAAINLWLLWLWLLQFRSWQFLRAWIVSQLSVVLLIAPSIPNYFRRLEAGHSPFVESLSIPHILNAQWSLFLGIPWQHATETVAMRLYVAAVLLLMLPLLALALRRPRARLLADLVWWILVADILTIIYWSINPVLHPRYMLFLTGPLSIVLSALIIAGWRKGSWSRLASLAMMVALVLLSASSLSNLYTGRLLGYRHDPANNVAAILRAGFDSQDGIITIDPNDYTLWYYGFGEAPLFRAGLDDGDHTPADLVEFMAGKDRVAVVQFHAEQSDKRHIIPFYLERFGSRTDVHLMESYAIYVYQMDTDAPPSLVEVELVTYNWEPLSLVGQSIQSGDALTVALQWQTAPGFHTNARYASIIRVVDPETGWLLGTASELILSNEGYPTSVWSVGEHATQYYVIPLVPGTPPIQAEVTVMLVDSATAQPLDVWDVAGAPAGQHARLGIVTLAQAPERWLYNMQPPFALTALDTEVLAGYAADWPTTAPGGTVGVTLSWLVSLEELSSQPARLALRQGNMTLASDDGPPLQGRTPATASPWLDRRVLHVSGEAQSGPADLMLFWGEEQLLLGRIEVMGFQRHFERPEIESLLDATFGGMIRLLGYRLDAPEPLTSGDTVKLTLYWQALTNGNPGTDYTVFAQLLDPTGRLIGQHDGIPAYGIRPTSGWLTGEFIIDEHPMVFREPYTGEAQVQVGLYNPLTFERLLAQDGSDAVVLPLELMVESVP